MLASVVELLRCPVCAADLAVREAAEACEQGHAFDIARQGYLNLAGATPHTGDSAAMLEARAQFLGGGHYAPLVSALIDEARRWELAGGGGAVIDLGAGTGFYLAAVLEALSGWVGLAVDVSKYAARRAARAHPAAAAVVADIWQPLPIKDAAADLVLDVFAPRNVDEVTRILHPGGAFIVVTPAPDHLGELVAPLDLVAVDPEKERRLDEDVAALTLDHDAEIRFTIELSAADAVAVAAMGPSAHHLALEELQRRVG